MANAKIYIDTRRAFSDGNFPVKLRVTHNRMSKYYPTIYKFGEKEFEKIIGGTWLDQDQKDVRKKLLALEEKANGIIQDLDFFTFETFKVRFTGKGVSNDLLKRLEERISQNKVNGKIGTASIDTDALARIKLYLNSISKTENPFLPLASITPEWLKDFEKWNLQNGLGKTSIFIYLVRIQATINQAIQLQLFDPKKNPFGKGKYEKPTPLNSKRALSQNQLIALFQYSPKTENEEFAKDFIVFSFLASGMNLGDVFSLKWSDFNGKESFTFLRRKTKDRTKTPEPITIYLRPELWEIIEKHGSRKIKNDFVFNIVSPDFEPARNYQLIKIAINRVNTYLKNIGTALEFDFELTSYFARHTYATRLMKTAPVAYISKQLGHSNISTTEKYLSGFEKADAVSYEQNLIPDWKTG